MNNKGFAITTILYGIGVVSGIILEMVGLKI